MLNKSWFDSTQTLFHDLFLPLHIFTVVIRGCDLTLVFMVYSSYEKQMKVKHNQEAAALLKSYHDDTK